MRTTWGGVPKELKEAATPLLAEHKRLLPSWVRVLDIKFDDDMTDCYACVQSELTGGSVTLTFGGGWLKSDEQHREWVVIHELAHTQLAPIERAWEQAMEALPKKMRALVDKLFEDALEESVSGLAHALAKEGE